MIDGQEIKDILTVNGVRFSFDDGSWGLIRASSNKPSLVIVTESPTSDERKKRIFNFIDNLLQKTGKIGEYDQKIWYLKKCFSTNKWSQHSRESFNIYNEVMEGDWSHLLFFNTNIPKL